MRQLRFAIVATAGALLLGVPTASAGSFVCTSAISNARATSIMGVPAQVTTGGGGEDDCGVSASGFNHITITGYLVKRSVFNGLKHQMRTRTYTQDGVRTVQTQRVLAGFGGPAFSWDAKSFFEAAPAPVITRAVFVYRNGRMLRPIATGPGPGKVASLVQLVQLARLAARGI